MTQVIPLSVAAAVALALAIGTGMGTSAFAQEVRNDTPVISRDVSGRVDALIYEAKSTSRVEFRGTSLAPRAEGKARVRAETANTEVSASFEKLPDPASLGPYTVYVLWAITPEGRSSNLGSLTVDSNGRGKIDVTTPLNGYAMIVTAEPHFLSSIPSNRVVLNNVPVEFKGRIQPVTTLASGADYSQLTKQPAQKRKPLVVDQARYAVAIAAAARAEELAIEPFTAAKTALQSAETAWASRKSSERRRAPELARVAIQSAVDARVAATRRGEELEREQALVRASEAARDAGVQAERAAAQAQNAASANARANSAQRTVEQMRADLLQRMNAVLPTRDTSRGLVAQIDGVQFATGKATLNGSARESLSRLSGVLATFPGLDLRIEGHTDSTGSDATNRTLSVGRAMSVRDYLVSQGVSPMGIDAAGLGSSTPVADNGSGEGRARNRRVEVIVSGMGITAKN